jgi:hypothetical protein
MNKFDLCLAWNWEYDADFIKVMLETCRSRQLSLLQVLPENLNDTLTALTNQQIVFSSFLDRASEADVRFRPLVSWAYEHNRYCLNRHEHAARSCDKATMHYTLINAGIYTPYTIILPSYEEQPVLTSLDLDPLGKKFIIKPAHGGGGEGVITEAISLAQVLAARREHAQDRYLLQALIVPKAIDSRLAWFRVLYCGGGIYPCWWNTRTKIYIPLIPAEEEQYNLGSLKEITTSIAQLSGLDLFSTEIALTAEGHYVVVDYVNDQPDLRLQSRAIDGVPDRIVQDIAARITELVSSHFPPAGQN